MCGVDYLVALLPSKRSVVKLGIFISGRVNTVLFFLSLSVLQIHQFCVFKLELFT